MRNFPFVLLAILFWQILSSCSTSSFYRFGSVVPSSDAAEAVTLPEQPAILQVSSTAETVEKVLFRPIAFSRKTNSLCAASQVAKPKNLAKEAAKPVSKTVELIKQTLTQSTQEGYPIARKSGKRFPILIILIPIFFSMTVAFFIHGIRTGQLFRNLLNLVTFLPPLIYLAILFTDTEVE